MKIKKNYTIDTKRQIWRIIPAETGKLIIEERDTENKQVYFNCYNTLSGKKIFKELQLEEKFWIGIETVHEDLILFHKFAKPDMPRHKGIIGFDIETQKILWENFDQTFLFIYQNKVYTYREKFEGRNYFSVDFRTGEQVEELGDDSAEINRLRNLSLLERPSLEYYFPAAYSNETTLEERAENILNSLRNENVISGNIEFILKETLLLTSFHIVNSKNMLDNLLKAVDLSDRSYILEEILNKDTSLMMTDSFFIVNDLLFVLFGKNRLRVYNIV
jgi:hypothetical protein